MTLKYRVATTGSLAKHANGIISLVFWPPAVDYQRNPDPKQGLSFLFVFKDSHFPRFVHKIVYFTKKERVDLPDKNIVRCFNRHIRTTEKFQKTSPVHCESQKIRNCRQFPVIGKRSKTNGIEKFVLIRVLWLISDSWTATGSLWLSNENWQLSKLKHACCWPS